MKCLIQILCFCLLISFGEECLGQNGQAEINIDANQTYQKIEGWGSSLCWWAAQVGNWNEAKVR